jgi:uroporphyrinogen decarboxylase
MAGSAKWERIEAAIGGSAVDRPPFSLWRHFPEHDRDPDLLAQATVDLYRRHDMDFVKVMFRSSFGLEDWGCQFDRFDPTSGAWKCSYFAVQSPQHWAGLSGLSPESGALGEQLRVLRIVRHALGDEAPILATVFAPSMIAERLAGRARFLDHFRRLPDRVHDALRTVARTVADFGHACLDWGADGIFYAIETASRRVLDDSEYAIVGTDYDRPALASLHERSKLTLLHLHGEELMLDHLSQYPAHVLNWYDRRSGPSLADARRRTDKCLAGGIDHERTLARGTPVEIKAEVHDAVAQLQGRGLIVAPGCGVPITTPDANLRAVSEAVVGSATFWGQTPPGPQRRT